MAALWRLGGPPSLWCGCFAGGTAQGEVEHVQEDPLAATPAAEFWRGAHDQSIVQDSRCFRTSGSSSSETSTRSAATVSPVPGYSNVSSEQQPLPTILGNSYPKSKAAHHAHFCDGDGAKGEAAHSERHGHREHMRQWLRSRTLPNFGLARANSLPLEREGGASGAETAGESGGTGSDGAGGGGSDNPAGGRVRGRRSGRHRMGLLQYKRSTSLPPVGHESSDGESGSAPSMLPRIMRKSSIVLECEELPKIELPPHTKALNRMHFDNVDVDKIRSLLESREGPLSQFMTNILKCTDLRGTAWEDVGDDGGMARPSCMSRSERRRWKRAMRYRYLMPVPEDVPDMVARTLKMPAELSGATLCCMSYTEHELLMCQRSHADVLYGDRFRVQNLLLVKASPNGGVDLCQFGEVVWIQPLPWGQGLVGKIIEKRMLHELKDRARDFERILTEAVGA